MKLIKRKEIISIHPLKITDARYYSKWLADSDVCKFQFAQKPMKRTEQEQKKRLRKLLKNHNEKYFLVSIDGHAIGTTSILVDKKNKCADFSIMIGARKEWGKGYGKKVVQFMLRYAFHVLKLNRVELDVFSFNKRAIHMYKKAGFKIEGKKKQKVFWNGKFYDEIEMGLLKSEWKIMEV